ncbi:MAG TPA: hypothetical protein VK501_24755 [Baekduia sp.]|uniref:hypothetical protein n=1 Tax=Baekduia sp. TaxID=2600305 RepID=UPI002C94FB37|nr:hypothetical protein [Baekduia sp.]HMJ37139.1 hypothetical protein [Baekduia sp.]
MTPDEQLVALMAAARRRGENFYLAWFGALDRIDLSRVSKGVSLDWRTAVSDLSVREGWRAAYEGFPDPRSEALAVLGLEWVDDSRTGTAGRGPMSGSVLWA